MYKKYIFCILVVIMTFTRYTSADPGSIITKTFDEDNDDALAYWTPERMKKAKPRKFKLNKSQITNNTNIPVRPSASIIIPPIDATSINTDAVSDATDTKNGPVGILFGYDPKIDDDFTCTASVINTGDGNIGITAAHCLYEDGTWNQYFVFCPGYNNGDLGLLGEIKIKGTVVWSQYMQDNSVYDYGMMKFIYNGQLQYATGAWGLDFNPGNQVEVTVFGYPRDGDMNCNKDGKTLCTWQGVSSTKSDNFRSIPLNAGDSANGGPWVKDYDPTTKNGWLIGNTQTYVDGSTISPNYNSDDFNALIKSTSDIK